MTMTSSYQEKKIVSESKLHVVFGICVKPSQNAGRFRRIAPWEGDFASIPLRLTFACWIDSFLLKIPLERVQIALKPFEN